MVHLMNLNDLVTMSNKHGRNPDLVLAGGGNTSAKDENALYVKGSGTSLATITEDGFVAMDRAKLAEIMKRQYPAEDKAREAAFLEDVMAARLNPGEGKRPSVEALLHNLFPQRLVLHLHPALVNGLTCSLEGEAAAKRLFGEEVVWVDECRPGYTLAKLCNDKMQDFIRKNGKPIEVMLLQNHGVFFAADTLGRIDHLLNSVIEKLEEQVTRRADLTPAGSPDMKVGAVQANLEGLYGGMSVHAGYAEALKFSSDTQSVEPLLKPFTPDHIVYCKAFPLFIDDPAAIAPSFEEFKAKHGYAPKIVIVKGMGFFALGENEKEAATAKMLFDDAVKIAVYTESFGGARHMADDMIHFIVNWEAESYRQKQSK